MVFLFTQPCVFPLTGTIAELLTETIVKVLAFCIDPLIALSKKESPQLVHKIYTSCVASMKTSVVEDKLIKDLKNSLEKGEFPPWSILYLIGYLKIDKSLPDLLELLHKSYEKRNDYIFTYASYSIYSIDKKVIENEIKIILESNSTEDEWLENIVSIIGELKLRLFIPLLIKYLNHNCDDENCRLSYLAQHALEKMKNLDDYLNQLLEMLQSNKKNLQWRSLLLLDRTTSYDALPEAIDLISSEDEGIMWAAYSVIMKSNVNDLEKDVIELILDDLSTGSFRRREMAAITCGKLGIDGARKPILDFLKESYSNLWDLRDKNEEKSKIHKLEHTINQLIFALGELKAEESIEYLIKILKEFPKWRFETIIGETIKKIGSLKYIEEIEGLLKIDENRWWIAFTAGDILSELSPSKKLEDLILNLLESKEYHFIRHACKLAKKLYNKEKIISKMFEILEPLYDDYNFNPLIQVVDTLTEIANISYLKKAEEIRNSSKKYLSSIGKHLIYYFHVTAGLMPLPQYEIR